MADVVVVVVAVAVVAVSAFHALVAVVMARELILVICAAAPQRHGKHES